MSEPFVAILMGSENDLPVMQAGADVLKQLGIKQESVLYTQGQYDFVETIEAPGPSSVIGFTIWYTKKGFGTIQTLPAFDDKEIRKIIKKG